MPKPKPVYPYLLSASDEPEWVEVMVEILLSLFSQPSRLFRVVSRNVFKKICPHLTKDALQLILNVFDPEEEQSEESAIVITDDKEQKKALEDQEEESMSEDSTDEEDGDEDEAKESDEESVDEDVNELFRKQLVLVLQGGKAADGEDSDGDVDDETMMALDNNLAALFAEQQKRIQAKKDEKAKIREEKILHVCRQISAVTSADRSKLRQEAIPPSCLRDYFSPEVHTIKSKSFLRNSFFVCHIQDAYLLVPIFLGHHRFLRFAVLQEHFQFVSLPFGLAITPRVFTKIMAELMPILRVRGLVLFPYLDDLLIKALSFSHASKACPSFSTP
ncbi:unnamed protein product [Ranitomeya imitator]|uniref:Reverse transcriptase domain-containing protein n=1 Tax=Ranitomeya imitator TaxID=111125 RepID=A0ABN9MSF1_9NEOB|nr:unnamed protein product [Ranitomeya imitator]